jgi:hypothetical protein
MSKANMESHYHLSAYSWDKEMSKPNIESHHHIVRISLGQKDGQTKDGVSLACRLHVYVTN